MNLNILKKLKIFQFFLTVITLSILTIWIAWVWIKIDERVTEEEKVQEKADADLKLRVENLEKEIDALRKQLPIQKEHN